MRLLIIPLFLILEIIVSAKLAGLIGAFATLVWLVAALFLGINLLRAQGAAMMMRVAQDMRSGQQPGQAIMDGLVKAVAAILLMVPGVLSDLLALICLIPWLRHYVLQRLISRWAGNARFHAQGFSSHFKGNIYEHEGAVNDPNRASEPDKLPHEMPRKSDD